MSIITRMRRQQAVYWALAGTDADGQPTWETPVQISVRWEDKAHEVGDKEGERQEPMGKVYVDRDVTIGGYLLKGPITSSLNSDPRAAGAYRIESFEQLPNLRATETLRTALLSFRKGTL